LKSDGVKDGDYDELLFSRMETDQNNARISIQHTKNLDVESEGLITDMTHFDPGN
jgi:hypothetical protein